jgi:hypothetical protein
MVDLSSSFDPLFPWESQGAPGVFFAAQGGETSMLQIVSQFLGS